MQCKDIPTAPILGLLADNQGRWAMWYSPFPEKPDPQLDGLLNGLGLPRGAPMPSVRTVMPEVPDKLAHAKMVQLISKGLVSGCSCGCRGDFEITDKGLARIGRKRTAPMLVDRG
jgi:hypothetical protein